MSEVPYKFVGHRGRFRASRGRGVGDSPGAGGFLGALVRSVPYPDAAARAHRRRLRGPLHAREGQHRRGAAHRRALRHSQHPHGHAVSRRPGRRAVRRRATRAGDPCDARQVPRAASRRRRNHPARPEVRHPIEQRDASRARRGHRASSRRRRPITLRSARCGRDWRSSETANAEPDVPALRRVWSATRRTPRPGTRWPRTTRWPATTGPRWPNGSS